MAQNKKISKAQVVRYQYIRRLVEAREVIAFPPLAEPLLPTHMRPVTYPLFIASERPEQARERIRLNTGGSRVSHTGGSVVSPVLYSLEFRKAWDRITDDSRTIS